MIPDHNERPAIWEAIQNERAALATRGETRNALDWVKAVTNRVLAKHNITGGSDGGIQWTDAMVMETWLVMELQENKKLEAASKKMAAMLSAMMPDNEDDPPEPGETPPDGAMEAMLLQEGPQAPDGTTVITREAVEMARAGISPGMSYSDAGTEVSGIFIRVWTAEVDGKLAIMVWMQPNPPAEAAAAPQGAPPGSLIM